VFKIPRQRIRDLRDKLKRSIERFNGWMDGVETPIRGPEGVCYSHEYSEAIFSSTVKKHLRQRKRKEQKLRVIDLGGGTGAWAEKCAAKFGADVTIVDFGIEQVARQKIAGRNQRLGREAIEFVSKNVAELPEDFFQGRRPDFVHSKNLLHFLQAEDVQKLLEKISQAVSEGALVQLMFHAQVVKPRHFSWRGLHDMLRRKPWAQTATPAKGPDADGKILRTSIHYQKAENDRPNIYRHNPYEIRFLMHALGFELVERSSFKIMRKYARQTHIMLFRKLPATNPTLLAHPDLRGGRVPATRLQK
jgi:trans-aconitate methyltransferase